MFDELTLSTLSLTNVISEQQANVIQMRDYLFFLCCFGICFTFNLLLFF